MSSESNPAPLRLERDCYLQHCSGCAKVVLITARGHWRCPECTSAFCPFCKTSLLHGCEHVVASWVDAPAWNYSPFANAPLPEVPDELQGLETTDDDWNTVFGMGADVVEEGYADNGDLAWKPDETSELDLFEWMLERRGLKCESSGWETESSHISWCGRDYFSLQRDEILAAIKEEVALLAAGLERLYAILRARQSKPYKPTGFRVLPDDDPIYKEGWTVYTPREFRKPPTQRGRKAKSQPSARPSGESYLFDVPEEDYRPRRASRLICRWFIDNPVGSTRCLLSLLGAPAARTFGLHFEIRHSEFPESLLFAELPRAVANDRAQLFAVLQACSPGTEPRTTGTIF